jgi:hypothetical protein
MAQRSTGRDLQHWECEARVRALIQELRSSYGSVAATRPPWSILEWAPFVRLKYILVRNQPWSILEWAPFAKLKYLLVRKEMKFAGHWLERARKKSWR